MKIINCQTLGELCEHMLDGEPVFVLRAQDAAAVTTVKQYVENTIGVGGKNIGRSTDQLTRMRKWQADHPDRVKAAD